MTNMQNDNTSNIKDLMQLGIYIHVPFCVKKCSYCDFLSFAADKQLIKQYFDALLTEIESYRGRTNGYLVKTIFIGGGTPSSVDASYIRAVMDTLQNVFQLDPDNMEATIEINPGTVTREKLEIYKSSGINRISFGLQSTDDLELKLLGRIHSFKEFKDNYLLAREVGFRNINIDLISALPGQTLTSWEQTLEKVIELHPEHISAYSLIIEEGTPFFELYGENAPKESELPEEEIDRLIYHRTKEILKESGYLRYEISNYAKEGYESRHNISYWTGTQYLGLGLGASSLLNGARIKNMRDIEQYIRIMNNYALKNNNDTPSLTNDIIGVHEDMEQLSIQEQMSEFMFLGLRMCREGISKKAFYKKFHREIEEIFQDKISYMIQNDLMVEHGDRLCLTDYGIDVSNIVLAEFLLD